MSFFEERRKMLEGSTETGQLPYKKTAYFATGEGERYEESYLALVFLRCLWTGVQFLLSSNDDAGGKFGDVVLCWSKDGSPVSALLVQLKHKEGGQKTIRTSHLKSYNSDFSIMKYHESYTNIKDNLDGDRYAVVLSTNADLSEDAKQMFSKCKPESVPGMEFLESGGCLYSLNKDNDYVKRTVQGDVGFVQNFYLFCNQCNTKTIKSQIIAELELLLGADENYCAAMCDDLCGRVREWINTEEVCLTGSWKSWLDIAERYIKEKVTMCNSVVTRIKYSSVNSLRAHIEGQNPAWIRPPGSGATALTATKVHQAMCGERHIMISVKHLTELHQEKVLSCWGRFCRWLVLVDDTEKSCDILHHMVDLSGPKRRLVIVSDKGDDFFQDTCKSADIPEDTWKELMNVEINLNSEQYLCCLQDLCDTEAMKAIVDEKPEALAPLLQLSGPVRMGQHLEPLPNNHIVRRLISRMHVREEFFSSLGDNDVCIMDKLSYNHMTNVSVNTIKIEELEKYLCASNAFWPIFVVTDNIDHCVIQKICCEYQNIHVYILSYVDNGWEILFLHRGSAKIRPYVEEQSRSLLQIVDGLSSRIIIDGKPGIGKSTFMLDIASQLKGNNPSWWILRIDLLRYSEVFDTYSSSVEAVNDILLRVVYNEKNLGILEHALLQHCLEEYAHIICLVDGFDEICPDYEEICLQALQQLAPRRGKLVVATRPSVTNHLEAAMGVLAHTLTEFSVEEVHRFHQGGKLAVTDVVVELLKIPLFSRMYAEALKSGIVVDDIVRLYEIFFEKKFRRLYEEKWCEDLSKGGKKTKFETELKKHMYYLGFLAVSHLLPELEVPCAAQTSSIDRDELVRAGVIYQFINDKPVFIHRTFSEHFLAKWCFSDVAKGHCAIVYQAALCDNSLEFFVESFDRMASRDRPLLTAVLNGSESEVESLLQKGADPAERDEVGRNSLHLAAAYGRDSALLWLLIRRLEVAGAERVGGSAAEPAEGTWEAVTEVMVYEMDELSRLSDKGRTSKSVQVKSDLGLAEASGAAGLWALVATDPVTAALGAEDGLLQWTPLRYAAERQRWRAVGALLEAGAQLRHLGDFQRDLHRPQALWHVFMEGGYIALFHLICGKNESEWSSHIEDWRSLEIKVGVSIVCAEMSPQQYKEISSDAINYRHWEVARLLQLKIVEVQKTFTTTISPEIELNRGTRLKPDNEGGVGSSEFQMLEQELMCSTVQKQTPAHGGATPRDADGWTVLHHAVAAGYVEGVRRLIDAGAGVDMQDNEGRTALHLAALAGIIDFIKLLLSAGAAVNMKDKEGATPLHRAVELGRRQAVRLLLAAGADALAQNCEGGTPLHVAARSGNVECVRLLVRIVRNLELKGVEGYTALHWAAHSGDVAIVQHLLMAGADTNAVNDDQKTPLHLATGEGFTECVRLLLQAKADVAAKDKRGATALHWAVLRRHPECVRCLLEAGADVNQVDEKGDTPLHWAAREGSASCIRLLLWEGADVQQRNRSSQTPLHHAVSTDNAEAVRLLLDAGADALAEDCEGHSPLHVAARSGNVQCVRLFVQIVRNLELKGVEGYTALHWAAHSGDVAIVKHLLAAGADSSAVTGDFKTPLHLAAWRGHTECVRLLLQAEVDVAVRDKQGVTALHLAVQSSNTDCVKCLLRAGAAIQEKDGDGNTPLHWAVREGSAACIGLLLREGADVHQRNRRGHTPLHEAAWKGKPECVKLLLDAGADALAQNCEGGTPLHWAVGSGNAECLRLLVRAVKNLELKDLHSYTALHYAAECGEVATVKHLLAAGADTNAVNDDQKTPLHLATGEGFTECVRLLLQAKADVAAKDKRGATALHWAVLRRHPECVRCLLEAGADVNQVDEKGDTPLHWAAREGSAACIGLLLREGADVQQRNRRGRTPLHEAAWKGKPECVKLLLDAGADALMQDRIRKTPVKLAADRKNEGCLMMLNRAVWDRHRTTN